MSVYTIVMKDGVKMMRPVRSREEYLSLRNSGEQQAIVSAVRSGDDNRKSRLIQMNYSCLPNADGSLRGSRRMSTTVGMDIDHIAAEEMQAVRERILEKKEELGLKMLEESARGRGYHLVFMRKPELSQEENLRWASELLGVEYDKGAKDITRVFFTTSSRELIYLEDSIFEMDMPDIPEISEVPDSPEIPESSRFPQEFKGIPYTSIIAEYWRRTGGEPTEGERNKRLHQLAANLRAICDNNEEWLLELMPRYGLSVQEMKSIIHSA